MAWEWLIERTGKLLFHSSHGIPGISNRNIWSNGKRPKFRNQTPTANSLVSQQGGSFKTKCAYCQNEHYSASCGVVRDIAQLRSILERDKRCFNCWRFDHEAPIQKNVDTASSGIISRFVQCLSKENRNRKKFQSKRRGQQPQQRVTRQRELCCCKQRRPWLLMMSILKPQMLEFFWIPEVNAPTSQAD